MSVYKTYISGPLILIGWAKFEAVVNYSSNIHICLHVCVARQPLCWNHNHFWGTTLFGGRIMFLLISLHFICSVLFSETLLRIWNKRFIKSISPNNPVINSPVSWGYNVATPLFSAIVFFRFAFPQLKDLTNLWIKTCFKIFPIYWHLWHPFQTLQC